jgi:hypothetical protein
MDYDLLISDKVNSILQSSNVYIKEELFNKLCDFEHYNPEKSRLFHYVLNTFFTNNTIYYISTSELYVQYKDNTYTILTENDTLSLILQNIYSYELQTNIKQQIKNKIHKKIKNNTIYKNIPNSLTLQNIFSYLHPNLFSSKSYAKYFIITLGDIIMKKTDLFYFIEPSMKPFIKTINKYVTLYFHSINLGNHYKFKYCGHPVEKSRIIKTSNFNLEYLKQSEDFFINLICVSFHYSNRFTSGDVFLEDITNRSLKYDVLWMNHHTKQDIVHSFINEYIYIKYGTNINEKDMLFLWKLYIKQNRIFNFFQKNEIREQIANILTYNYPYYMNVNSLFLPYVEQFKSFWGKYIFEDNSEFEIGEFLKLFMENTKCKYEINEEIVKDLIKYYYPSTSMDEKNIYRIGCVLWNKKKHIDEFLEKNTCPDINVLYNLYTEYYKNTHTVSKQYFIDYVSTKNFY